MACLRGSYHSKVSGWADLRLAPFPRLMTFLRMKLLFHAACSADLISRITCCRERERKATSVFYTAATAIWEVMVVFKEIPCLWLLRQMRKVWSWWRTLLLATWLRELDQVFVEGLRDRQRQRETEGEMFVISMIDLMLDVVALLSNLLGDTSAFFPTVLIANDTGDSTAAVLIKNEVRFVWKEEG